MRAAQQGDAADEARHGWSLAADPRCWADLEARVIPTTSRFKVPKYISYPIGAEILSAALVAVPQYGELQVTFFFAGAAPAVLESAKRGAPVLVLSAEYAPWRRNPEGGPPLHTPEWHLWVRPVPSVDKAGARGALIAGGMSKVSEWLSAPRSSTWRAERHALDLRMRFPECRIEFEES